MLLLKTLHIVSALALFLSFGAIFMAGDPKRARPAMAVHGIAILLLVAVGLHLLFAQGLVKSGGWWHAKILIAVVLGVAPLFVRRQWLSPLLTSTLCLLLGGAAAWLALAKPF